MSTPRLLFGLVIAALLLSAAIVAGDTGGGGAYSRATLVLALLAVAALAVQSALLWRTATGEGTPIVLIRGGAVQRSAGGHRSRPVSLSVESGQAVVVERNGLFYRVVGPGLTALLPGETVYKVVSTQPRTLTGALTCATRDGIPVTLEFEVSARIMATADDGIDRGGAPQAALAHAAPFEPRWSEDALIRAAYETHSWETAALGLARSSLRALFESTYLSDLCLPAVSPQGTTSLESLQSRCGRRMSTLGAQLGISIEGFQIVHLGLPPELASGNLPAGRGRRQASLPAALRTEDDTSSGEGWTAIHLASVLGGGPFVTFRQAMRAPMGEVTIPDVLFGGQRWEGRSLGQTDPNPYALPPECVHFDVQVHGRAFQEAGIASGDHVLFASRPEPSDGDIVAVLLEGRLELRRFWQKTDHVLLEPERESQPPVAVVAGDEDTASMQARYGGSDPAVEIRPAAAVKVLGRAAIAFRPQAVGNRAGGRRASSMQVPPGEEDAEPQDVLPQVGHDDEASEAE